MYANESYIKDDDPRDSVGTPKFKMLENTPNVTDNLQNKQQLSTICTT